MGGPACVASDHGVKLRALRREWRAGGGGRPCARSANIVHMKRTNLILDETLLEAALKATGARTYSAAVNIALAELVRRRKVRTILDFVGSGVWEGDLSEMRDDSPRRSPGKVRRRASR